MLTATSGLDLDLGEEAEGPIDPVESVLVEVGRGGLISVDRRPLALDQLLERLAPILAQDARKPVIVIAIDGAEYGDMVNVLDELRQGKRKLGLAHDIQIALPTERESAEWRYAVSGG